MALPEGSSRFKWPPERNRPELITAAEHDAWYSGDPERLAVFYGQLANQRAAAEHDLPWWRFYGRTNYTGGQRTRATLHVPLPGDIAATSAAMLFGEQPSVMIPEAHSETPDPDAEATEERLLDIIERGGLFHRLAEAAEQASAIGGVYLKIGWDEEVADHPFILVQQGDSAIPEWRMGMLHAVTFWRVIERQNNGSKVIRHLERYERGAILHGLYRGTDEVLGERIPLTSHEATADLPEVVEMASPGILGARYVPNMRPNRRFRGSYLGQSDYSGVEGLFDALDETFTDWMRDVRLAKARLVVPEEWLTLTPTSTGPGAAKFDLDQEVFSPLNVEPGQDKGNITSSQFAIRAADFEKTAMNLIERAVTAAGYSPQTFGLHIEGRAESGTALRMRERKTQITRERKAQLWATPLADMLSILLVTDAVKFHSGVDANFRPRAEIKDGFPEDINDTAAAVELINRAGAASTETLVRMLHPEWDDAEIVAEVARIREQNAFNVPDPTTLGIPQGDEDGDEPEE